MTTPDDPARAPVRCELTPADLDLRLDPAALGFDTTTTLTPLDEVVGQDRGLRALRLGLAMRGYHVYVSGISGTDKKRVVKELIESHAAGRPVPDDWIYLHNFVEPDRPRAFPLPAGRGSAFRAAMNELVIRIARELPQALKAKDFRAEQERLSAAYGRRSEALFNELVGHARGLNLGVQRMPEGMLVFVPLKDGRPLEPADVEKLNEAERADFAKRQEQIAERAADLMARQEEAAAELRCEIEGVVRGCAKRVLTPPLDSLRREFPTLAEWLDQARDHMLNHLERFNGNGSEENGSADAFRLALGRPDPYLEYRVNVVVDNSRTRGAPVVVEIAPHYRGLFGTVEHEVNAFGRASTDFTRIKAGSLLRANGGYLILDFEDAVTEPMVWKQLKRALESKALLTDAYEPFALVAPLSLKPEPIPLTTKVIALGRDELYYLLRDVDDDFGELFKTWAEFGEETNRTPDGERAYARFIARMGQSEGLPPFDAAAVTEVIRFGIRRAGHRGKLSTELDVVADLVRESCHWAVSASSAVVGANHVRQALDERIYHRDRIAAKMRELLAGGVLRVSLAGSRVGQVNGLAVTDLGDYRFGHPNRVTASAGVGQEGIVNIERESDLSGNFHDKGVLILEGYLRNRYARQHPLALSASLAFEQSYAWIEGDSASLAELLALLSALASVPLRQDVAVTGSVNQHGEVQAVGAVTEKVEGFFDVCRAQELSGTQGVCVPRSNVANLILKQEVVDAIGAGRFHAWAVDSVDEAIELLTGMPAGDVDRKGTFHHRLDQSLREILRVLQEQPAPEAALQVRIPSGKGRKPIPPPLPGDRG